MSFKIKMKVTNVFKVIITTLLVIAFTVSVISCKEASVVEEHVEEQQIAEKAAVAAESAIVDLSTQELVDAAQVLYYTALPLVTALETGAAKDDLITRLETVQTAISAAKVLLDEAAATEAVVAAEAAIVDLSTQALVDMVTGLYNTANDLVTSLPEGTVKDDLTARLVVVQDAIEEASSSLAGPKIAFVSDRDDNFEIYIMNVDGSGVTRLTNSPAYEMSPCFSPDGSKVAFFSERDGNREIYIMNVDGSGVTRLTNNPGDDFFPTFSPDGSKIIFVYDYEGFCEIYIMDVDGSDEVNLTNNPANDFAPCFSPDGSKIAFVSDRDDNFEIYIMNVDGSGERRLTDNPEGDGHPCFSPDGSKIAFVSDRNGNEEIYIMNADGSEQVNLTNSQASDMSPCFSPDGSKIAFQSYRDDNFEIYIMNADGSGQVNLTNDPGCDVEPCFSP